LREWIGLARKRRDTWILSGRLLTCEWLLPRELRLLSRELGRLPGNSGLPCRWHRLIRIRGWLLRLIRVCGLLHGNGLARDSRLPWLP
jgi:hypothetical protein